MKMTSGMAECRKPIDKLRPRQFHSAVYRCTNGRGNQIASQTLSSAGPRPSCLSSRRNMGWAIAVRSRLHTGRDRGARGLLHQAREALYGACLGRETSDTVLLHISSVLSDTYIWARSCLGTDGSVRPNSPGPSHAPC